MKLWITFASVTLLKHMVSVNKKYTAIYQATWRVYYFLHWHTEYIDVKTYRSFMDQPVDAV